MAEVAIQMGYIEPWHGIKGRQHWIADDDLHDMYQAHRKNKIMFWVYTGMKKRPQTPDASHPSKVSMTGYNSHVQEMLIKIEEIVDDLEKQHKETYTRERYNVLAHMINLRRHSSRESAPHKPYFRGTKGAKPKSKDADIPTHATFLQLNLHLYLLQSVLR